MPWKCDSCKKEMAEYPHRVVLFATMSDGFVGHCCFDKYDAEVVSKHGFGNAFVPRGELEMWTRPDGDWKVKQ